MPARKNSQKAQTPTCPVQGSTNKGKVERREIKNGAAPPLWPATVPLVGSWKKVSYRLRMGSRKGEAGGEEVKQAEITFAGAGQKEPVSPLKGE